MHLYIYISTRPQVRCSIVHSCVSIYLYIYISILLYIYTSINIYIYISTRPQVRCSIVLDDSLLIREANLIARAVRQKIEQEVADVAFADIHLELEDNCWGQCGQSLGPTCAVAEKMQKRKATVLNPAAPPKVAEPLARASSSAH